MDTSEKRVLAKIRKWLGQNETVYNFWFTYTGVKATGWEGSFGDFAGQAKFRNQYTIPRPGKRVVKNWD